MAGERKRKRVAVVGGGIAGLTCAYRLTQTGNVDVTLLEATTRTGGVLHTTRAGGYLQEHAANGVLSNAEDGGLDLCRELSVPITEAGRATSRRWIYTRGRLRALPMSPPELATTDLLSWRGKLRLLAEPLQPRGARRPGGPHDETVAEFVRRRLGDEVLRGFVAPFVTGIYAGDVEALSLAAAFPKLARLEDRGGIALGLVLQVIDAARGLGAGRGPGPGRLWAPVDGMAALTLALSGRLGEAVSTGAPVVAIARDADAVAVVREDGDRSRFDAAVLAVPAPFAARIVSDLEPELSAVLDEIEYAPIAVVQLGYPRARVRHPLDGFGFLVAEDEDLRLLGCVFESMLWPGRASDSHVLLRCMFGGTRDPAALDMTDDDLVSRARDDLAGVVGVEGDPDHSSVVRWPRAVAQYNVGHLDRVDRATRLARPLGIELTGSSYRGVSVNDCVANARRAATAVIERLGIFVFALACAGLMSACSGKPSKVSRPRDGGDASAAGDPTTPDGAAAPYTLASVDDAGTVAVKVEWPTPPARYLASPGRNDCGSDKRPPVSVHTLGGLRSAVVTISGIDSGRAPDPPEPAELSVTDCRLEPPVLRAARLGGELEIYNRDERRHDVVIEHLGDGTEDPAEIARLPMSLVGQRYQTSIERPGIVRVTTATDGDDHAYVVIPGHPYVALTNDKGEAILDLVPAGTYEVTAWHRPLARGGPPLTARASITVEQGKKARATLSVAP